MTWQPIETAPRDGTWTLVYHPTYGVFTGRRHRDGVEIGYFRAGKVFPCGFSDPGPTHWMPLPEPPTEP